MKISHRRYEGAWCFSYSSKPPPTVIYEKYRSCWRGRHVQFFTPLIHWFIFCRFQHESEFGDSFEYYSLCYFDSHLHRALSWKLLRKRACSIIAQHGLSVPPHALMLGKPSLRFTDLQPNIDLKQSLPWNPLRLYWIILTKTKVMNMRMMKNGIYQRPSCQMTIVPKQVELNLVLQTSLFSWRLKGTLCILEIVAPQSLCRFGCLWNRSQRGWTNLDGPLNLGYMKRRVGSLSLLLVDSKSRFIPCTFHSLMCVQRIRHRVYTTSPRRRRAIYYWGLTFLLRHLCLHWLVRPRETCWSRHSEVLAKKMWHFAFWFGSLSRNCVVFCLIPRFHKSIVIG